ncbi:MAG TPA: polysaccharide lyase family 8 super-sandwich domain-containing protein, partial [Thermoanaerobaculia bacterium]|nr:polysaccharide lyase family 8 super-sandwich domain-containing protein [Thermoanaerobaculia bacterium]
MKRLLPILLGLALPLHAEDIDIVRQNFVDYYTAAGAPRSSERMEKALSEMEWATATYIESGYLLSDGGWSDIDYSQQPDGAWSPWEHVRRLTMMARAYRTHGQRHYGDPALRAGIESALAKVNIFYNAWVIPTGNWWFWTIGVPLDLGPTLVLMRGDIDPQLYDDLVFAIELRIGSSPTSRGLVGPVPVGQNLVWSSFNHLALALLRDEPQRLAQVREAMARVTLPAAGDGVKSDASFHQHGAQLYTGGYGASFAIDVAKYALIARGSSYELPPASLDSFAAFLADGMAWSIHGSNFDLSAIGRSVANPHYTGFNGVAALVQASQLDLSRATEIRGSAAKMLEAWPWGLPVELAGLAARVEEAREPAAWPSGYRHYYESDYSVFRRPGWLASVKMFSIRTKSGERTNGENLLGSRQSDGRFHLALTGDEYYGADVRPALDWSRLPGITVEKSPHAASDHYGFGTNTIAGGTGDGRNGVSAMDVAPLGSTLRAKKSWFFFGDAIVFLTSAITSSSSHRVETVINQWPLDDPDAPVTGPNWSVAGGIGYYLPSGAAVQTARETRSGSWTALSASNTDASPRSATLLTMWIDHGVMPSNAVAEYVIVPDITPDAMRSWVASNPITIVANTPAVAAVRRDTSVGIVFWSAGSIEGYQSDAPAIVYSEETADSLQLSVADPTNGTGTIRITVPGRYSGPNATAGVRSTTISFPRDGGRTTTVSLTPLV